MIMRELKRELWPHKVSVNKNYQYKDLTPIELWLGESLGAFKTRWNVVYRSDKTDFYFQSGEDAMLFKLTWT